MLVSWFVVVARGGGGFDAVGNSYFYNLKFSHVTVADELTNADKWQMDGLYKTHTSSQSI